MHYILDNEGYVEEVSFGGIIECKNNTCSEYTGKVPTGYSSLEDWHFEANIRAYKVVDGDLVFDPNRDYKLRILFDDEAENNRHITKKELGIKSTDETRPFNDIFPNLTSEGSYINRANTYNNVGNFSTEKVELWNYVDQDLDFIELEFIGRNFLPNTASNTINNGITYTMNIDKTINVSGVATDKSTLNLAGTDTGIRHIFTFKRGETPEETDGLSNQYYDYIVFGLDDSMSLEFYNYDGVDRTLVGVYKNYDIIKFEQDTNVTQVLLTIEKGTSINTKISPMLALAGSVLQYPILPMTYYAGSKNIFDGEYEIGYVDVNTGINAGAINVRTKNYIPVSGNTTYTISGETASTRWGLFYDENKNYFRYVMLSDNSYSGTFTTPENARYIRWYIFQGTNVNDKTQLEIGSVATTYNPYDNNNERVGQYYVAGVSTQTTRSSKNILPNELQNQVVQGLNVVVNEDKSITLNGTTTGYTTLTLFTNKSITLDGTYALSTHSTGSYTGGNAYFNLNDGTSNFISLNLLNDKISTNTTKTLVQANIFIGKGVKFNNFTIYPMLEKNDKATEYEQYKVIPSPDYPSEIINIYKAGTYNAILNNKIYEITIDRDLRSVPSGVADRLWFDADNTGVIEIETKVGITVLNGSENFEEWYCLNLNNTYGFKLMSIDNIKVLNDPAAYDKMLMSSHFKQLGHQDYLYVNDVENISSAVGNFYFRISKDKAASISEVKEWFSTHNTEIYYELATYTTSPITTSNTSEYSSYNFDYEEYKNNTTLIDLAGNKFERFDSVVIENNQAFLVKEGAIKYEDENGNEIDVERETVFLGYVSMPRTYTPETYCYSHQRVIMHSFTYRDCRNIDVNKMSFEGILSTENIQTNYLAINGISVEENIKEEETPTTTLLNDKRVYKKLFAGRMPSTTNSPTDLFTFDFECKQVWIDGSLSFIADESTTFDVNYNSPYGNNLSTWVNKEDSKVRFYTETDMSSYTYNIVLAYTKEDIIDIPEPEEPEIPEEPIVNVNKVHTLSGSTSSSVWAFKTVATEVSIDRINKTSTILVENYLGRPSSSSSSYFMGNLTINYTCNGKTESETVYKNSGTIAAGGWCKLGSRTFTITHTTEPMTISVGGSMSTSAFSPSSASANGSITLTEI